MEQQLEQADEKIVEQLQTIQKLNRDKDQRDQEIFDLKEGGAPYLTWCSHFVKVSMILGPSQSG